MFTSAIFRLNQLDVQPGQRVLLRNVTWDQFEQILSSGEHRASRLAYYQGTLEIMVQAGNTSTLKLIHLQI